MKNTLFISVVMLFWTFSMAFAENISVTPSQKSISLNDSFSLTFSSQKNLTNAPDFSPLEKDFEILSNSQEHNTSIINGAVSQQIRWKLVLMAKREGDLAIPAIQFGSSASTPLMIEVKSPSKTMQEDPIFLETNISPAEWGYEQTVLIYTIRLYTTLTIAQAAISELKVSDPEAIIEQLGGDVEYEHYSSKGKYYKVIQRKFTVIPHRSGELVFSPIIFEGRVTTGRNSFFDIQSQFKRITSDQHKVMIKPIPSEFQRSNWFGANDVNLSEEWSADPGKMVVGEPMTWTLKIEANGCLGSQIPDITLKLPDDLRHYLDKPELSTQETANGLIGTKQIKIALISTKPGDFELPEVVVKWWDLKSNQLREQVIPKRMIHVQSDLIAMASPIQHHDHTSAEAQSVEEEEGKEQAPLFQKSDSLPVWVWGLVAINGFILVCLLGFFCKKISFFRFKSESKEKPDSLPQIKELLKKACQANDAKKAESYLIDWAGCVFPSIKPLNIISIKPHVSEEMQIALDQLYCALYGSPFSWSGETLWVSLKTYKPQKFNKKGKYKGSILLKELYPVD